MGTVRLTGSVSSKHLAFEDAQRYYSAYGAKNRESTSAWDCHYLQ